MCAHRTRVHVDADHKLRVTLPHDFPVGEAEVIVTELPRSTPVARPRLTLEEFLAPRLTPPAGVGPVTIDDIERAIAAGRPAYDAFDTNAVVRLLVRDDEDECERAEKAHHRGHDELRDDGAEKQGSLLEGLSAKDET